MTPHMTKPLIQIALDLLDFHETIALAKQVAPYADIIEIGTPCIKSNGLGVVSEIRERFPDRLILADLKTMDAGEYESTPFYAAGADICTVLGVSDPATIAGVVRAARNHNAQAQIDLINVPHKAERIKTLSRLGARIIGIHTGLDGQAMGQTPFSDLREIVSLGLDDVRISVAGGIGPATVRRAALVGADIIVVGTAVYGVPSPAKAAREIRRLVDTL
uniref:3-hexulose-6-phosphate synthase n=1 Tax=Candidatus Kentrum sp. FW TaxID=2126338 RepID=A0A450TSK2_9GAMM|nr:MAG: 3-hexulose-6-phosphate synthase [Candidatus Kentron sp. FW]